MLRYLSTAGAALILVGFALALLAVLLMATSLTRPKRARGAGIILLGPFPIAFGTDRESLKLVLVLAIALVLLAGLLWLTPIVLRVA